MTYTIKSIPVEQYGCIGYENCIPLTHMVCDNIPSAMAAMVYTAMDRGDFTHPDQIAWRGNGKSEEVRSWSIMGNSRYYYVE